MNTVQVGELTVKIEKATAPTGLIQEFQSTIRFGAATFNNNGSGTECGITSGVPCYKACSISTTRVCYFNSDCPAGESCIPLTRSDGGKVITYISNAAGDLGTPNTLVSDIGAITATTWTPFAEAFYTSIGYFARTNAYSVTPATSMDFRLQTGTCSITTSKVCKSPAPDATWQCPSGESCVTGTDKGDYDLNMNPSQARCQKNNILLITDGQSTADVNSTVTSFVSSNTTLLPSSSGRSTGPAYSRW